MAVNVALVGSMAYSNITVALESAPMIEMFTVELVCVRFNAGIGAAATVLAQAVANPTMDNAIIYRNDGCVFLVMIICNKDYKITEGLKP